MTKYALLPAVLRRGSEDYPTSRDIAMRLEELYGASFDCGVSKKGERHLIHFYTEFLSKKYTPGNSDPFAAGFDLLYGIISKPVLENGRFSEKYLSQEKDKLRMLIESRVNNKMQYSVTGAWKKSVGGTLQHLRIWFYRRPDPIRRMIPIATSRLESYPLNVSWLRHNGQRWKWSSPAFRAERKPEHLGRFTQKRRVEPRHVTEAMNVTQGKLALIPGLRRAIFTT